MSDGLRIDLALARAAGLPERAANDARLPLTGLPLTGPSSLDPASRDGSRPDGMFSPLALLLARFLPPTDTATPPAMPTPDEARLLQAYLQQRVVAVLRAAGVPQPATLEVRVEPDGALRLTPAPPAGARYVSLLRDDPDIAQLAAVLQRTLLPQTIAPPHHPMPETARDPAADSPNDPARWPWWLSFDSVPGARRPRVAIDARALGIAAITALLLAWWLLR